MPLKKKWVAVLLLVIAVGGTFVPCCQIDDCCSDKITNTAGHENHEDEGSCSPFIACGTCPGFIQLAKTIEVPKVEEPVQIHHTKVFALVLSTYSPTLFQPPRIG